MNRNEPSAGRLFARLLFGFVLGGSAAFQAYGLLNLLLDGEGGMMELVFGLNAIALLLFVLKFVGDGL